MSFRSSSGASRVAPGFLRLAAAAGTSALAVVASACAPDLIDTPPDFYLLYTSNVHGYIEPCGCVAGQIGGVDRIAAFVENEREEHPELIFVDGGDLFMEHVDPMIEPLGVPDTAFVEQVPLKADAMFHVWSQIGCEAMALGETDLVFGAQWLRELSERHGVPILCGNLVDEKGEQVFPSSIVVERAGKRIGIFSVLGEALTEAEVENPRRLDVAAIAERQGLQIQNWRQRARELTDELAATCDMVFCLSHLGYRRNSDLAAQLSELDLVFGGHFDNSNKETYFVKNTPVLISVVKGSRVGRVQWWLPQPEDYFQAEGHGPLMDVSEYYSLRDTIEVERLSYDDMEGREHMYDTPEEYTRKRNGHALLRDSSIQAFEALPPLRSINRFAHSLVPMHQWMERSEPALETIDRYHEALHEYWMSKPGGERDSSDAFPGADACVECHPAQYEFWLATRHSRAFATLESTLQHVDAECVRCHTVGYRLPGGFQRPGRHQGFENVQCAACHGGGGPHMRGGVSYLDKEVIFPGNTNCTYCHDKHHDPEFEGKGAQKLPLVACPPMDPLGGGTAAMLASFAEAADELAAEAKPRLAALVYACLGAGDPARGARYAEQWVAQEPGNPLALSALGECLVGSGEAEKAISVLESVTRREPSMGRAWAALAEAHRALDHPKLALHAALEATSLLPDDPYVLRMAFELLEEQDQHERARELLLRFSQAQPLKKPAVEDLLAKVAASETARGQAPGAP